MRTPNQQRGTTLIEVLITMMMVAFGLLGLAGLISKTTTTAVDTNQQARAVVMLQDIADRMINMRTGDWTAAATAGPYGAAVDTNCAAEATARGQACRWGNTIAGVNDGGPTALAMRGCIARVDNTQFWVTVTWVSTVAGTAPPTAVTCGDSMVTTANRNRLRYAQTLVRLPVLSANGLGTVSEP